jgi:hypothetical protein
LVPGSAAHHEGVLRGIRDTMLPIQLSTSLSPVIASVSEATHVEQKDWIASSLMLLQ